MTSVFGVFALPQVSHAACNSSTTSGNLYGVIDTEMVGPIYVSTESWNDDPANAADQTSVNFFVNYDRSTRLWSGRGWNETFGWVDFGYTNPSNTPDEIFEFEHIKDDNNPSNPEQYEDWGGLTHEVDVSGISYTTNTGAFSGSTYHGGYTAGASGDDEIVGGGDITFNNLQYIENTNCNESVDITLNGANILYRQTCPIPEPTIRWVTQDIVSGSCVTDSGLWNTPPTSRADNNPSGEQASGDITSANTPVTFRLKCEGSDTRADVFGTAVASCGPTGGPGGGGPIDPTTGLVIPNYIEI